MLCYVFERRTPTEGETFSLLICLDATRFVLLSGRPLIRTIRPLPADMRRSKKSLLKLCLNGEPPAVVDRIGPGYQHRSFTLALLTVPHVYSKTWRKWTWTWTLTMKRFSFRNLIPVTQLYVSVDASTKESLKKIDRPLFRDFWPRFLDSLKALSEKVWYCS